MVCKENNNKLKTLIIVLINTTLPRLEHELRANTNTNIASRK